MQTTIEATAPNGSTVTHLVKNHAGVYSFVNQVLRVVAPGTADALASGLIEAIETGDKSAYGTADYWFSVSTLDQAL